MDLACAQHPLASEATACVALCPLSLFWGPGVVGRETAMVRAGEARVLGRGMDR